MVVLLFRYETKLRKSGVRMWHKYMRETGGHKTNPVARSKIIGPVDIPSLGKECPMDTTVTSKVSEVVFHERVIPAPPGGKSFLMMETQVTQALYEAVMGENPSHFKGAQKPVETVSWEDGVKFANALSRKLGLAPAYEGSDNNVRFNEGANGFRLPFEAEWEFAAKGGQGFKYAGSDNLSEVGWYSGNSGGSTHDVAQLKPNGYGLYDMSGNVWEWCWEEYDYMDRPLFRTLRAQKGGGFRSRLVYISDPPDWSDQAHRIPYPGYGIRLVRCHLA